MRSGQAVAEHNCLRELIAGKDAWPRFWDLFGRVILSELKRLGLAEPPARDELFQELALKLLRDEMQIIRDYVRHAQQDSFAALLRVILRNMALDYLRFNNRRACLPLYEPDGSVAAGLNADGAAKGNAGPESVLDRQQLQELLCRVTGGDRTSDSYRIMYLRYVEHEDVNLIAQRFALKPNTVSQRIKYYLEKLREHHSHELAELGDE